jgi:hypothetical protein
LHLFAAAWNPIRMIKLAQLEALDAQDSAIAKSEVLSAFAHRRWSGITIDELAQEAALFCLGTTIHGELLRLQLRKYLENLIAARIDDDHRHDELNSVAGRQKADVQAVSAESRKQIKRRVENPEKHPAPELDQEFVTGEARLKRGWTRATINKLTVHHTAPSGWNRARAVRWYDVAMIKQAEGENGGALRLRNPRSGVKIPRLPDILNKCAGSPVASEIPPNWLSREGPPEPWATLTKPEKFVHA